MGSMMVVVMEGSEKIAMRDSRCGERTERGWEGWIAGIADMMVLVVLRGSESAGCVVAVLVESM